MLRLLCGLASQAGRSAGKGDEDGSDATEHGSHDSEHDKNAQICSGLCGAATVGNTGCASEKIGCGR